MRSLKRWVCVWEDSKVPMKAWEKEAASSTNPDTWSDFETALESYNKGFYDYCGFVFAGDGYVGIDIDAGVDEDGFMTPLAADIVSKCQSYTERSRSGRGFHILLRGDLPFKGKNNLAGVEIYKASRYFIMTGDVLLNGEIIDNQSAINYVIERYFSEKKEKDKSSELIKCCRIYRPKWSKDIVNNRIPIRPDYPKIHSGGRNLSLASLAGYLHNTGYTKRQIYRELLYVNDVACVPPLDAGEIRTICDSITRYRR